MKIFLTGVTGQVGFELHRSLSLWGEVLAPTRQELDLSDMSAVNRWLEMHAPDCIVNAAAYTAVDKRMSGMFFDFKRCGNLV
ncbi:sugar nucleotide-binding protein, partial [Desulfovibrio piger]|uniref:sugar nucleotide-binding protein n=1 Tax=Desulfovibrio piger TaxID=901 RepID=UPI0026F2E14B